ncbi:MAG: iron-containing alcohol dehydrogenase [Atopobiaceae bacterium]|jgi:alcohol dehydrogenase|nr:iron-containing alcohol dehydrogenase [Atopobiaceae bacterium]
MSKLTYESYAPTRVLFGPGQLNHLHEQAMPGKKAMVVISNGKSTRANGSLDRALAELETAGVQTIVFDKVGANPTKEVVEAGAFLARDEHVDFVVALGGGSVMDAAKVMAMFAPQPGDDLWDYAGGKTGRRQPLVNPELPWIAITTTAGTGSEVDSAGVVTNLETREKIGIGSPNDFAQVAIVDPELMLSVPARFTAYQGFDALFHSLEGYISNQANPMSDMVQLAAIENIGTYLPRAVADGSDLEARAHVAFANTMSGYSMVFSACTSEHSMEHAMSAFHPELPHGAGLTMISLAYFGFWIDRHVCDERFVRMAQALGRRDASEPSDFLTALRDLQVACGVDDLKMSDYGFTADEFLPLAKNARETMGMLFACDPAPTTDEEIAGIYARSFR